MDIYVSITKIDDWDHAWEAHLSIDTGETENEYYVLVGNSLEGLLEDVQGKLSKYEEET